MSPELDAREREIGAAESRNLLVLALSGAMVRVGWIFKIESVLIPAFLDSIAGSAWLRGLLPVINRIAQSVPGFLLALHIKRVPRKKSVWLWTGLGMAAPFLLLGGGLALLGPGAGASYTLAFLVLYGGFFVSTGLNMLVGGTLSGKLLRAERRGRLLTLSTLGGSVPAVILAVWLLPQWLDLGDLGWPRIFGVAGLCFAIAGLLSLAVREPADHEVDSSASTGGQLAEALAILRSDHDFRLLVGVGALVTCTLMLIPHYQALGRVRLGLGGMDLMSFVVAQTVATGAASGIAGPMADRYGNRLTLRVASFLSALVPVSALLLAELDPRDASHYFVGVFAMLGLTPICFRVLTNYILELAPAAEHTRYLSISQLCNSMVILLSPLVGLAIDEIGFAPAFLTVAALLLLASAMTFRLVEPRFESDPAGDGFTQD